MSSVKRMMDEAGLLGPSQQDLDQYWDGDQQIGYRDPGWSDFKPGDIKIDPQEIQRQLLQQAVENRKYALLVAEIAEKGLGIDDPWELERRKREEAAVLDLDDEEDDDGWDASDADPWDATKTNF